MTEPMSQLVTLANELKAKYSPADVAKLARLLGPTPSTGEMSAEDFERLLAELQSKSGGRGYSAKSIEAVRQVFVMGATPTEAAAATGVTKQAVGQVITRIRRRMEAASQGWVKIERWFPEADAKKIAAYADTLDELRIARRPLAEAPLLVVLARESTQ